MAIQNSPYLDLGRAAPDFRLKGTDGAWHTLASARGPQGILVMFICNHCPYVKAVLNKIIRDATELQTHGVGSIAIMSNDPAEYPEDSWENMVHLAREKAFPFPYVLDQDQSIAKAYGAVCTPDFFGYNSKLELEYRGRIDGSSRKEDMDAPRELFAGMVMVADTGAGPATQAPSVGCSIKWRNQV